MNTISTRIRTAAALAALTLAITPAGAQLAGQLGVLDLEANGGINPATGNAWLEGDTYRLVFVTSTTRDATSTEIADYNTFVQETADAASLNLGGATWKVIASTETVNVKTNTSTDSGTGEAIFLMDGITIVANDYTDLWDGNLTNGINLDENGELKNGVNVFAGTENNGSTVDKRWLGSTTPSKANNTVVVIEHGRSGDTGRSWIRVYNAAPTASLPFYALSDPLTVGTGTPATFPLAITPAVSGHDLVWTSQDGMLYNVWSTTDPSKALADWDLVEGEIAATGTGTNTRNVTSAELALFYRVEEFPPPPVTLLEVDFESGDAGFTAVNHTTGTIWTLGDPDSTGEGGTVATGNGDSTNCWGTDISNPGFHANGTDTSLISPVIDLTGVAGATLSFAQALDILAPNDTLVVNVIDDTTDTVIAAAIHTSTPDTDINAADWETIDSIAITGGEPVRIEWRFTGDGDGSYMGAYIDDVLVTAP